MIRLPAMKVAQGEPFSYDVTVVGQDWTGWTGTATFKVAPKSLYRLDSTNTGLITSDPFMTVTVEADATGLVQFSMTATETATFPALPVLGYRRQAVCEISMTDGTDVQKFQATVLVAAQI